MGDFHNNQHTHYHEAPPSRPRSKEISLLDALAFEQMDFRSATIAPAYANTCDWLFSASPYKRWRDHDLVSEHKGFLWIKGKPGAGKSTLMKHAWDHAQVTYRDETTVSFFFNARGAALGKSVEGMYRCLLHQIVDQVPHLSRKVAVADRRVYQSSGWPVAILQDLFRQAVIHLCQQITVSCYIDALDEGDDEDQVRAMVESFYELAEQAVSNSLPFSVCLASRYYPKISVSSFEELRLEDYGGHGADISKYVHKKLRLGSGQLKQQLASEINLRSRGVFLWVVLVIAILNRENDRGNQHLLLTRLQEIPDDLLQLFEDLRKLDPSDNRFLPAIEWVLHAMRPLGPNELYIAILTSTSVLTAENFAWIQQNIDAGTVDDFIVSSSKGFLEVGSITLSDYDYVNSGSDRRVQFIHETVREYFLAESKFGDQSLGLDRAQARRHASPKHCVMEPLASNMKAVVQAPVDSECPDGKAFASQNHPGSTPGLRWRSTNDTIAISHAHLSQVCQTYIRISHASDLQQKTQFRYPEMSHIFYRRPFLDYSFKEVLKHASAASTNGRPVSNLAKDFPWDQWVFYELRQDRDYGPAGHAYHRMDTWLQRMVYQGQPQLVSDELSSITAGARRSLEGEETARSLLNACVSGLGSALHLAVALAHSDPHLTCLKLLLESGADVNKACKGLGTPLHVAMIPRSGHDPHIDGLLLRHGANPNAKDDRGNSPLHYAILARNFRLVETLVGHGADLNGRIGVYGNAAQTAGQLHNRKLVKWLADLGADVDKQDSSSVGSYSTGIHESSVNKLLADH
jgi:hypothetical protein